MLIQLAAQNGDYDLFSGETVLSATPSASAPMLCQVYIAMGDGVKNLSGVGGDFKLFVYVDNHGIEPCPQVITFGGDGVASGVWTAPFPVPANKQVDVYIQSPNAADSDVDVTAYLYDTMPVADASGRVALGSILGTALTETAGGYLAAAFKKLFDVASPVMTSASVNQSGDTFAKFSGITSLAAWLRGIFRKDAMNSTAKTEVNAGGGTYDETTDSNEALRDRGDAAWITATSVSVSDKTGFSLASPQAFNLTGNITGNITGNLSGSVGSVTGTVAVVTAAISALQSHGDTTWLTATGFSTPANVTASTAAIEAYGDIHWPTATGFATAADLASVQTHGDTYWATAVGFATPTTVSNLQTHGDLYWTTATGFATPGDQMDLVNVPNSTAVAAIQSGLATTTTITTLSSHGDSTWATATGFSVPGSKMDIVDAPSATGRDALAGAVWDIASASHVATGSTGKKLSDAGTLGDPWSTAVPGSYAAGTAGYNQGLLPTIEGQTSLIGTSAATVVQPMVQNGLLEVVYGNDYTAALGRPLVWTETGYTGPAFTSSTTTLKVMKANDYRNGSGTAVLLTLTGSAVDSSGTATYTIPMTHTDIASLSDNNPPRGMPNYVYELSVTYSGGLVRTVDVGNLAVIRNVRT